MQVITGLVDRIRVDEHLATCLQNFMGGCSLGVDAKF